MGGQQPLGDLGPEILLMIFEELYSIAPESFSSLRLTSHKLIGIVTPFIYRHVALRTDIVKSLSEPSFKDAVQMIRFHARHVEIRCLLDWDLVAELLFNCQRLEIVTWTYWKEKRHAYLPEQLQRVLGSLPHVSLCIDSYTYPGDFGIYTASHTMSIPATNLVSFTAWSGGNVVVAEPLQDLLVASQRLDTLVFKYMHHDFTPTRGRLPPLRRLVLSCTVWRYTLDDVNKIWNFSRLEDLEIPWLALGSFLSTVSPNDLCRLKCLRVDESHWETGWQEPGEAKRYQETVAHQLQNLLEGRRDFEELDIECLLSIFDISLIARHSRSLRVLRLFDTNSFKMEEPFPTVSLSCLRILQTSCIYIRTLDLGMNIANDETPMLLDILCRFRNLRDLTLHIETRLQEDTVDTLFDDTDHQSAVELMKFLVPRKSGAHFSKLSINVGWWKRKGRSLRDSCDWHRREQGRNPERLFVFKWNGEGTLLFHEQMHAWQRPWPGKEQGTYLRDSNFR